jgi:hypothetical protein
MSRYDPGTPRLAVGIGAITMAAATFGLLVVLPSQMEPDSQGYFARTAVAGVLNAACDAVVSPACWRFTP